MYVNYVITDTIRVPPAEIGGNLKKTILEQAKQVYEGVLDEDTGIVIAVTDVGKIGDGKIVPGDGAAYYDAEISLLAYKPKMRSSGRS